VADNGLRPLDNPVGNLAAANTNINPYQNVSNPPATYGATGIAGSSNSVPTGQSPIVRTLQPQPRDKTYSQGNNYLYPASRRNAVPTPAQPANNAPQPTWRESSSSDTRLVDENVETVSHTEAKDAHE
jgi:hypothetical protein